LKKKELSQLCSQSGAKLELNSSFVDEAKLFLGLREAWPKRIIRAGLKLGSTFGVELM